MRTVPNPEPLPGHVTIRSFRPSDQGRTRAIVEEALTQRWGALDPSRNPDLADLGSWYANDTLVVATVDDAAVGIGCLIRESDCGRIVRLYVTQVLQRTGIGSALLRELLRTATVQNLRLVRVETTASWSGSRSFYQRHGFRLDREDDGDAHYSLLLDRGTRA